MSRIPRRVRAWGALMDRMRSMHVATMTDADIARNQTLRHVPAPVKAVVFGPRVQGVVATDAVATRSTSRAGSGVPVRVYRRSKQGDRDRPLLLYFHGGGWTLFGGLDACDHLPSVLAARLDAVVVAVDYRLAPRHPHPAQLDDCEDALLWAVDSASSLGASPARVAVVGDSAGGHLAAAVTLRARRLGGPVLSAQALIYPVVSRSVDDASMLENAGAPVLHRADMVRFLSLFTAEGAVAAAPSPEAFPEEADSLAGLPPAFVQLGSHDVLRDQGRRYTDRLEREGVAVRVAEYPDAPHGWVSYPRIMSPIFETATADLVAWLEDRLAP
ncbi:carboxylesterase NlhH [Cnuibacter physcomitrellae]|uniref:Uncharacterized protein n=1 Tax=Cnuibacter physcomitrellae TaxID=1619308 RepID=A0A1X9LH59_9MICO|nr:alpha/beta hydrolase [Cnuibacter physcomitrellae]ARJ04524.1 hypothetical protein B5808_04260 [Cnuibacter physcomitrellae]GGI41254.1 carboxylesterase NlhH [Cnuibacter physcomitrellae]